MDDPERELQTIIRLGRAEQADLAAPMTRAIVPRVRRVTARVRHAGCWSAQGMGDALALVVAGGEAVVGAGLLVPVGPVAVGPVAVELVGPVAVEPVGPIAVEPVDPVGPLNGPSFDDSGTANGFSGVPGLEPPR